MPASPYMVWTMSSGRKIQYGIAARKTKVFFCTPRQKNVATSNPASQAMTSSTPMSNGANQPSRKAPGVTVRSISVNTNAGNAMSMTNRLKMLVVSARQVAASAHDPADKNHQKHRGDFYQDDLPVNQACSSSAAL